MHGIGARHPLGKYSYGRDIFEPRLCKLMEQAAWGVPVFLAKFPPLALKIMKCSIFSSRALHAEKCSVSGRLQAPNAAIKFQHVCLSFKCCKFLDC